MVADVSSLVIGLTGAVIVSIYSTEFIANSGFIVPRTIPSTAVIFSEPNNNMQETSSSRKSVPNVVHKSCSRPLFQQGTIVKTSNSFKKRLLHQMVEKLVPPPLKSYWINSLGVFFYVPPPPMTRSIPPPSDNIYESLRMFKL